MDTRSEPKKIRPQHGKGKQEKENEKKRERDKNTRVYKQNFENQQQQQQQQQVTTKLTEEEKQKLQQILEEVFSRSNLEKDATLVSQMNAEMWVPVRAVANTSKIKSFTSDFDLIIECAQKSTLLSVDLPRYLIKPNYQLPRTTIILRDLPEDASHEEVAQVFSNAGAETTCPTPIDLRKEIGDCWFAKFANEDDAITACQLIKDATFRSQPIHVRMKTESLLKSFYLPSLEGEITSGGPPQLYPAFHPHNHDKDRRNFRNNTRSNYKEPRQRVLHHHHHQQPSPPQSDQSSVQPINDVQVQLDSKNKKKVARRRTQSFENKPQGMVLQLGPAHFPPLPSRKLVGRKLVGYDKKFIEYSAEELYRIIMKIGQDEVKRRPEDMPSPTDCPVVLPDSSPNITLQFIPSSTTSVSSSADLASSESSNQEQVTSGNSETPSVVNSTSVTLLDGIDITNQRAIIQGEENDPDTDPEESSVPNETTKETSAEPPKLTWSQIVGKSSNVK